MSETPSQFDVTLGDFADIVIENSYRLPVLVDFWAAWCQPCRILTPLLDRLLDAYSGAFLLAKVDTDQEQELARQYGVRGLPTVKVFRDGQVVDELVGVQPEAVYREVIERYRIKASDRLLARADDAWQRGQRDEAMALLREALTVEPDNAEVKRALAETLLATGEVAEARAVVDSLPPAMLMEPPIASLLARLEFAAQAKPAPSTPALRRAVDDQPDDAAARQQLGARLVEEGDYEGALEQFLELARRHPTFGDAAGRKGLLAVFNILGTDDPLVATYRRRLSTLLH